MALDPGGQRLDGRVVASGIARRPGGARAPVRSAAHGDYATNVALRLAGQRRSAAARGRRGARRARVRRARRRSPRVEVAGPGSSTCSLDGRLVRRASLGDARRCRPSRSAAARPPRPSVSRSRWCRRTRPGRSPSPRRATAPTATASPGCSPSPATTSSASTTTTTPARRWTSFRASVEAARRGEEPPEDGYHGDYIADLAREPGDPVPRMLEPIEASLERFRIHFDTFERQSVVETEIPEAIALLDTFDEDGALWARTSAHGDEKDRVLVRSDGTPTYFAADAAYVRRKYAQGLRPARLRPRRRPSRLRRPPAGARRDARPSARLARGADLPARAPDRGRRGDEDVEAPRRRRLPRRLHRRDRRRRGPLVPRLARPRPDDRDRRRPGGGEDGQEPRLLRAVRPCADRGDSPQRAARTLWLRATTWRRPRRWRPRSATS